MALLHAGVGKGEGTRPSKRKARFFLSYCGLLNHTLWQEALSERTRLWGISCSTNHQQIAVFTAYLFYSQHENYLKKRGKGNAMNWKICSHGYFLHKWNISQCYVFVMKWSKKFGSCTHSSPPVHAHPSGTMDTNSQPPPPPQKKKKKFSHPLGSSSLLQQLLRLLCTSSYAILTFQALGARGARGAVAPPEKYQGVQFPVPPGIFYEPPKKL